MQLAAGIMLPFQNLPHPLIRIQIITPPPAHFHFPTQSIRGPMDIFRLVQHKMNMERKLFFHQLPRKREETLDYLLLE